MKTLIASLLIILSASAFADDNKTQNMDNTTPIVMVQPEFVWGDADADFNELGLSEKAAITFEAPEFVWGNADFDATTAIGISLTVEDTFLAPEMPDFVWGDDQDQIILLDAPAVSFPDFVWGDASESIELN